MGVSNFSKQDKNQENAKMAKKIFNIPQSYNINNSEQKIKII